MQSADDRIGQLPDLLREVNQRHHCLEMEIDSVTEQWEGLTRAGGQRADHAATLLSRLRPILHDLSQFCATCEKQIDALVANPFGRDD
jgi:predicted  nucleic acid-binding Zn-ribbon protein